MIANVCLTPLEALFSAAERLFTYGGSKGEKRQLSPLVAAGEIYHKPTRALARRFCLKDF